eukprot:TRINITY_DN5729_c0_g1_i1.p3 TRINITY_DN5729_c0_g1~~TRINITY_DN5729_c0_g1_i1.p3  ORF type:complete len:52 (-),score=26.67 TRINITY_DN5729_c0_g1_i1:2-157(-)
MALSSPIKMDKADKEQQKSGYREESFMRDVDKKKKYRLRGRSSETAKAHRG